MVVSNEVLDALKSIGLNLYERKIYVALLAKGVATAGEVSEIAKVPRSRSYDILESLADKGFVIAQPAKPMRYVALAPKDALERSKENLQKKHTETIERLDKLKSSAIVDELERVYKEGFSLVQPFDMTGTLKGRYVINQQLRAIFKQAKKKINIITTAEGLNELYSNHYNILKKMSKLGVKINILTPLADTKPANAFSDIAQIKSLTEPLGRIVTVDDNHLILSLTDDKKVHHTQDVAFWANSDHATKNIMQTFFNQAWNSAKK